jgi:hypothetical protein
MWQSVEQVRAVDVLRQHTVSTWITLSRIFFVFGVIDKLFTPHIYVLRQMDKLLASDKNLQPGKTFASDWMLDWLLCLCSRLQSNQTVDASATALFYSLLHARTVKRTSFMYLQQWQLHWLFECNAIIGVGGVAYSWGWQATCRLPSGTKHSRATKIYDDKNLRLSNTRSPKMAKTFTSDKYIRDKVIHVDTVVTLINNNC